MRQPRALEQQLLGVLDALPPASPAPSRSLSPRSLEDQLAALTLQAEIAEATARLVTAEQSVALGRRRTSDHLRATEEMAAALSAQSVNVSLAAPPLVCPAEGSELVRVLHALEERHQEERRAAEAREERYHRAAEARDAEYRAERAASDARFAALLASDRRPAPRHVIGAALRGACPALEGKPGQDISECLAEFLRLTAAHEIPPAFLSNEGIIKLKGNAARWFQTAFPGAADACPAWADVQSALLHSFTRRCTAAGAHCALNGARRIPGSTGPEAVQRVAELVLALNLKGVPLTAGPKEQLAHVCQNQLSEQEFSAWSAAANAHHEVSDAALAALESAAATDRGSSLQHLDDKAPEFRGRRDKDEGLACAMADMQRGRHLLRCSRRGTAATRKSREDPLRRVKGAALPGRNF